MNRAPQPEFSLSDLLSTGVPVAASEATAIVHHLASYAREHPHGVFPSLDDVYLTPDGVRLGDAGAPVQPGRSPVRWLGRMLHDLLAYSDPVDEAMPLGLQFLISRACGHRFGRPSEPMETGAFRPFQTTDELIDATKRFLPAREEEAIGALYRRAVAARVSTRT
jgi:hypothetical protein